MTGHISGLVNARVIGGAGITTVRDVGSRDDEQIHDYIKIMSTGRQGG